MEFVVPLPSRKLSAADLGLELDDLELKLEASPEKRPVEYNPFSAKQTRITLPEMLCPRRKLFSFGVKFDGTFEDVQDRLADGNAVDLERFEKANPRFREQTDKLWKNLCWKKFSMTEKADDESWRDAWQKGCTEEAVRLQGLVKRISQKAKTNEESIKKAKTLGFNCIKDSSSPTSASDKKMPITKGLKKIAPKRQAGPPIDPEVLRSNRREMRAIVNGSGSSSGVVRRGPGPLMKKVMKMVGKKRR
ncbi:hypothetical protein L596_000746 [Steinernema carpocapsae]|uniref:Uncharacterized protein n=1 Tax=Steinernema carpocapsae TaxID=34508 RepID=A0A4U8UJT9_STECR|nr:hypothetical protein L596_000746 [Steinernema carpocapsae]